MARGQTARKRRTARRAAMRQRQGVKLAPTTEAVAPSATPFSASDVTVDPHPVLAALELRSGLDPRVAAMAVTLRKAELAAATGTCENCDHPAGVHENTDDGDGMGACTETGCTCEAFEAGDDTEPDADDDEATAVVEEFSPTDDLLNAMDFIRTNADGPAAHDWVRARLTEFEILAPDQDIVATIPAEHQPGSQVVDHPEQQPVTPAAPGGGVYQWSAILCPEGELTSDGRAFAPGAITWRDLPLSLMAMTETSEGGHVGAEVAGRIDEVWRDEAARVIRAKGVFASTEYGQEIAALVADKTLTGVSVDLAISQYRTGPRSDWFDEDGNWAPREEAEDTPNVIDLYSDDIIAVVLSAEIGMATVCPFQAFTRAKIAMGDSLIAGGNAAFWTVTQQAGWTVERCDECTETIIASAGLGYIADVTVETVVEDGLTASAAGLTPERPPADWFADPGFDGPTPITVDDDGRISGHAALWGVCHIGMPGQCRTAPHSLTGYRYFHLGEVACEDGSRVAVGQITLDTGHADLTLRSGEATAHYDNTGTVVAYVCAGEDEHGIWVAGALRADAPETQVRKLMGAKLSGDWRKIDGEWELVALLCVNVPGFPVPRSRALVAAGENGELEAVALVAAGIPVWETELTAGELEQFRALQAHAQFEALATAAA